MSKVFKKTCNVFKVLRMSQLSIGEVAAGKLVNLLSNDVARFDLAFMFLHYLWLVPLQLAVVMYFLYEAAGYAPFIGLFGVILLVLPIQGNINYYSNYFIFSKTNKTTYLFAGTSLNMIILCFPYSRSD